MRRGFSLIELIFVIALIAMVGSLVVVGAQGMLRGLGEEPVERILQKAVREARFQAAAIKDSSFLRYDAESGDLIVEDENGEQLALYNTGLGSETNEAAIIFQQILPVEGLNSFDSSERYDIKRVVFRPDRSSTPFEVTINEGNTSFTQRFDPFSAIVIEDSRNAF